MTSENPARPGGTNSASRTILLIGLGLGLVTAVLIALVLSGNDGDDPPTRVVPATRLAVVARTDIPARTRLTRELLEVKTYDIGDVDSDAFTSVNQALNRVTSTEIKAGNPIVPALVSATTGEGLTFAVAEGKRAISISVSEVVIAGGNLAPGNHVDVIATVDVGAGGAIRAGDVSSFLSQFTGVNRGPLNAPDGSRLTFTVVQDVRVLAVAQTLPPDVKAPASTESQNQDTSFADTANVKSAAANPKAGTVTVEVTPQQAQVMVTADLTATLRLAVRAFGDSQQVETTPIIIQLR